MPAGGKQKQAHIESSNSCSLTCGTLEEMFLWATYDRDRSGGAGGLVALWCMACAIWGNLLWYMAPFSWTTLLGNSIGYMREFDG